MDSPSAALVLAAGEGTRMRPLTARLPKPLLPVAGKTLLGWTLEALEQAGVERVVVLVGYRMQEVQDQLSSATPGNLKLEFLIQSQRLGTGHAVLQAQESFDAPFFTVIGDVLLDPDTLKSLARTTSKGAHGIAVKAMDNASHYGLVESSEGLVTAIREKPKEGGPGEVNAGIYLFQPAIFDELANLEPSPRGEYELTTSLNQVAQAGKLHCHAIEGEWLDVGRPWDLLTANALLMERQEPEILGEVEEGATLKGWVRVEEGALVKSGSYIEGPVLVGPRAIVGPNAYVRGVTNLGPAAKVGAASEVKNSIIGEGTAIPHHNYVGDSVIGRGCNLGSGTKVANLRLDKRNISAVVKGERIHTGRRKLGVIMGDNVQTGINASLNVGCVLGEDSFVGPGVTVAGFLAPRTRVL